MSKHVGFLWSSCLSIHQGCCLRCRAANGTSLSSSEKSSHANLKAQFTISKLAVFRTSLEVVHPILNVHGPRTKIEIIKIKKKRPGWHVNDQDTGINKSVEVNVTQPLEKAERESERRRQRTRQRRNTTQHKLSFVVPCINNRFL